MRLHAKESLSEGTDLGAKNTITLTLWDEQ